MNRRKFLSYCMKGGVSVAALTQLQLQAFQGSLSYNFEDHKALVCVFLFGGNDSLNMLVPLEGEQRTLYEASRQNLAVTDALQLAPVTEFAGGVGLHPAMSAVKNVFDEKNLAFVSGVGSLVVPTTKVDYQNESVPLPKHLFSHNDQQATWMHGREKLSLNSGWGARLLERLEQGGSFVNNISLAGTNPWQTSVNLTPFSLHRSGVSKINPINGTGNRAAHVKSIMNRVLAQSTHPLASAYGSKMQKAITNTEAMNSAIESSEDLSSYFSDSSLSQQLHTVAKSISVRETLNAKRQIYFVSMGGFDTHDNQLTTHPALLGALSQSLSEFNAAMSSINANDDVTLFTMSDFGRTLTSNGDGTDHGWAGNQIIMGGAVNAVLLKLVACALSIERLPDQTTQVAAAIPLSTDGFNTHSGMSSVPPELTEDVLEHAARIDVNSSVEPYFNTFFIHHPLGLLSANRSYRLKNFQKRFA